MNNPALKSFLPTMILFTVSAVLGSTAVPDKTLIYRQTATESLKAFVFTPNTPPKNGAAILLFHGGAWQLGDATWMFQRAREFANRGMVAVSIDYRLANNGLAPSDGVKDACAAFTWVREHAAEFGVDPHRVAGYGWSAGGHLVAAAATLPEVKGAKVPATARPNALLMYSPALNMGKDPYFIRLMTGKGDPALYSPSEFITHQLPPSLIIQGEADTIVLTKDAKGFCELAKKVDVRCDLHVYPGVGHLLTRNLKVQYKDFDSDPADAAEAHRLEDEFLKSLGYIRK